MLLLAGLLGGCGQNYSKEPVTQALAARGLAPVAGPEKASSAAGGRFVRAGEIHLGGLSARVPQQWREVEPSNRLRRAQFELPAAAGAGPAVLAVFYFPPGEGGSTDEDIARWVAQFGPGEHGAQPRMRRGEVWVHGMHVTTVALYGTHAGVGAEDADRASQYGLLGAIVEAPAGRFFFKLTGPRATVDRWEGPFGEFLSSLEPEQHEAPAANPPEPQARRTD